MEVSPPGSTGVHCRLSMSFGENIFPEIRISTPSTRVPEQRRILGVENYASVIVVTLKVPLNDQFGIVITNLFDLLS